MGRVFQRVTYKLDLTLCRKSNKGRIYAGALPAAPERKEDSKRQVTMENTQENVGNKKGLLNKAIEVRQRRKTGLLAKAAALRAQSVPQDTIIGRDGVFLIRDDLETSSVKQDPALKALIDSVLNPQNS